MRIAWLIGAVLLLLAVMPAGAGEQTFFDPRKHPAAAGEQPGAGAPKPGVEGDGETDPAKLPDYYWRAYPFADDARPRVPIPEKIIPQEDSPPSESSAALPPGLLKTPGDR